jgi:thioester reductase-like protein
VYRLGRVTAARNAPSVNASDLMWRVARAATSAQAWPHLPFAEPWTPVDDVARTFRALLTSGSAQSPGRVYHLVQSGNVELARLRDALVQLGHSLPVLPLPAWLERLRALRDDDVRATIAFFELAAEHSSERDPSASFPVTPDYAWDNVRERLPDLVATPVTDELLLRYCEAAQKQGVLVPPRGASSPQENRD